jgi:ribonucleoside-diphosphate reductase beta chain
MGSEGWKKDAAGTKMESIVVTGGTENSGRMARKKLAASSPTVVLCGRPHVDLFHQPLDLPPNCGVTLKLTPSPTAFHLIEAANGTTKVVLLEARLFVRTKKVAPELVLAHKEMLQKGNMRFPLNRVTVTRYGIATGFKAVSVPMNFPAKLPKRIFIGLVSNEASTGTRNKNPFNFQNFGLQNLTLTVNGVQVPMNGLEMDYEKNDCMRAYLNTLQALGLDGDNRAIDITPEDFLNGYTIYGFKVAPGPVDGVVHSLANSVGSITANLTFAAATTANIDMIVLAETPATLEIDKLSGVTVL